MADCAACGKRSELGETNAVLENRSLSVEGKIGRRFAAAGGRVQIGRKTARRLRLAQEPARVGLADRDIAGREIGENAGAGERRLRARWHRHPQILAHFGVDDEARQILGCKEQIRTERSGARADRDLLAFRAQTRSEMPMFVEFAVIRQMHFWHDAEKPAAVNGERAIVETRSPTQRCADENQRQQVSRGGNETVDGAFDARKQSILEQQVVDRIAGNRQFRKDGEPDRARREAAQHGLDRQRIGEGIGYARGDRARGNADKTMPIDRSKAHFTHEISSVRIRPAAIIIIAISVI